MPDQILRNHWRSSWAGLSRVGGLSPFSSIRVAFLYVETPLVESFLFVFSNSYLSSCLLRSSHSLSAAVPRHHENNPSTTNHCSKLPVCVYISYLLINFRFSPIKAMSEGPDEDKSALSYRLADHHFSRGSQRLAALFRRKHASFKYGNIIFISIPFWCTPRPECWTECLEASPS